VVKYMKKRQNEEYEREMAEMERERSIANTELMGRFGTAYNWMPDNTTNYLDIGSSWDILRCLTYNNESNMRTIATDTNLSKVEGIETVFKNRCGGCGIKVTDINTLTKKLKEYVDGLLTVWMRELQIL